MQSLHSVQTEVRVSQPSASINVIDRKQNIIVFGVSEDCDPAIWCQEVESIFGYVHGQRVEISDMFRLGRFCSGKTRPVKLHAVDRRIILNNCRVLKNYSQGVSLLRAMNWSKYVVNKLWTGLNIVLSVPIK